MVKQAIKIGLMLALCLSLWPLGENLKAQTNNFPVTIINTSAEAKDDGVDVQVYFSIPDPQNVIKLDPDGQMQLTNQNSSGGETQFPATIKEPDSPIRIVLLLDASGSMAENNAMDKLKEAAINAVKKAPNRAEIAVFRFTRVAIDGKNFKPVVDFTNNPSLLEQGINAIKVDPTGGTCLYNATYQAINYVKKVTPGPQDRRAVIVFTDGINEFCEDNRNTPESEKVGGNQSVENVINWANEKVVTPLYTIGLCTDNACSKVDQQVLKRMADQTKAYSKFTDQNGLGDAFNTMMTLLKNQWVAQAKIQAQQGDNDAILRITSENKANPFLPAPFRFNSPNTYITSKIAFSKEPIPDETKDQYLLNLKLTHPEIIDRVEVEVLQGKDKNSQVQVLPAEPAIRTFPQPATGSSEVNLQFAISAAKFKAEQEYCFRISAFNKNGQPVKSDDPNLLIKCVPKYDPRPAMPKIEFDGNIIDYNRANDVYQLKLRVTRPELVDSLEIKITDKNDLSTGVSDPPPNRLPDNTQGKAELITAPIIIDAKTFKVGQEYCFNVWALDRDGKRIRRDGGSAGELTVTTNKKCVPAYNPVRYNIEKIDPDTKVGTLAVTLSGLRGTEGRTLTASGEIMEGDKVVKEFTNQKVLVTTDNQKAEATAAFTIAELPEAMQPAKSPKPYKLRLRLMDDQQYKEQEKEFTVKALPPGDLLLPILLGLILFVAIVAAVVWRWRWRLKQSVVDPLPFGIETNGSGLALPERSAKMQRKQPSILPPGSDQNSSISAKTAMFPTHLFNSEKTTPESDLGQYTIIESEKSPVQTAHWSVKILNTDTVSQSGQQFELPAGTGSWVIGRDSRNSQILVKDDRISRQHAELKYSPERLELIGNRSSNGTFVGEEQRQLEAGKPYQLKSGDVFWLSRSVKFQVVRIDEADSNKA